MRHGLSPLCNCICYDMRSNKYGRERVTLNEGADLQGASKVSGGLLALTAILGVVILGLDNVLRMGAPAHYYALMGFVVVDFAVGTLVITRPTKTAFSIVIGWCLLRIILQVADISQASAYQFSSYAQFADYLFNPASGLAASLGNPPGVPAALIDLIIALEMAVVLVAWKSRRSQPN